jgi:hypothetical protein
MKPKKEHVSYKFLVLYHLYLRKHLIVSGLNNDMMQGTFFKVT